MIILLRAKIILIEPGTQTDLNKLRALIQSLDETANKQHQTILTNRANVMLGVNQELMNLLSPVKETLENLEKQMRLQELERKQMRALQEVGGVINSSLELENVLDLVMDTIINLTGAERGFMMLLDEDTGDLDVVVARNIEQQSIEKKAQDISYTIIDSVVNTGIPVVTTNAQADPRFATHDSIISYNLRSILCVPLRTKEVTIGVIYTDNRVISGIFQETDRDLLASFANQAAVAIENARLFAHIREQLADITEMKYLMDDVFASIPSGVITIDVLDQISMYNRAAERLLGIPETAVVDQVYQDVLSLILVDLNQIVETVRQDGEQFTQEIDLVQRKMKDKLTLNLTCTPLRDVHQQMLGVTVVLNDVSEKKRIESLRRYLPPALVDRVRDVDAAQRPQRQILSVMFADIRGFSTFSEKLDPEALIQILNVYFTIATQAISKYEGVIDKFMGDAVMALFNTPLNPQENHVERAVRAAYGMQQALKLYHQTVPEAEQLHFGIGLHVGEAVIGNVGSQFRRDYSAIGDSVNLAKRLQEFAQAGEILLSQQAYEAVQSWVVCDKLAPVQVKGRQALEQLYRLKSIEI